MALQSMNILTLLLFHLALPQAGTASNTLVHDKTFNMENDPVSISCTSSLIICFNMATVESQHIQFLIYFWRNSAKI